MTVTDGAKPAQSGLYRGAGRSVGQLTIVRRWRSPESVFALLLGTFMLSFLVFVLSLFIEKGKDSAGVYGFLLAFAFVPCILFYSGLTGILNQTTISVTDQELLIRHGPLPGWLMKRIPISDIVQIFCEAAGRRLNRPVESCYLNALLQDGQSVRLLAVSAWFDHGFAPGHKLPPVEALFIEQTLEQHLHITDVEVAGEYSG